MCMEMASGWASRYVCEDIFYILIPYIWTSYRIVQGAMMPSNHFPGILNYWVWMVTIMARNSQNELQGTNFVGISRVNIDVNVREANMKDQVEIELIRVVCNIKTNLKSLNFYSESINQATSRIQFLMYFVCNSQTCTRESIDRVNSSFV